MLEKWMMVMCTHKIAIFFKKTSPWHQCNPKFALEPCDWEILCFCCEWFPCFGSSCQTLLRWEGATNAKCTSLDGDPTLDVIVWEAYQIDIIRLRFRVSHLLFGLNPKPFNGSSLRAGTENSMSVSKTFKRHPELLIRIQVTWDTYPFDESGGWWACANLGIQSTLDNCNLQLVTNRYCSGSSFVLVCVSVNNYETCQIWHLLWWSLNFSKYVFFLYMGWLPPLHV